MGFDAESRMLELLRDALIMVPAIMVGWAAIRRAEALVIWAKRKSPRENE
jgi:hypothetical protein